MEHDEILELYRRKDPRAVQASLDAYGYDCRRIAMNILAGEKEAEACVRAAAEELSEVSSSILPTHPDIHLQALTRSIALEGYRSSQTAKRGYNLFATVLDELSECRPAVRAGFSGGFDPKGEAALAGDQLTRFLRKQGRETRDLFLCRYFYAESLSEIARRFHLNENRVKSRLCKTRKRLSRFLEQEPAQGWYPDPDTLAQGIGCIDPILIRAAHGKAKSSRRLLPWAVAACIVAVLAVSFPYLRTVINTDLVLRGPDWNKDKNEIGDAETPNKPDPEQIASIGTSVTLADSTLTLTAVTETTATLTLVKTSDEPLYAAVYDRMGDALACTDPDYKVDGVTIRAGRIKVYGDGAASPETVLPHEAGSYTLMIDFSSIRDGSYPMEEYLGIMAYIGKDGAPEAVYFSLLLPETEPETETSAEPADSHISPAETAADTSPETRS